MVAPLLVLEILLPRERHSVLRRVRAIGFWLVSAIATAICIFLFFVFWRSRGIPPLISIQLDFLPSWAQFGCGVLIATLIGDFFFYWRHRIQHTFFWRYHSVHHSIEELNAMNSYHHPTEGIFQVLLVLFPLSLLFSLPATGIAGLIFLGQGYFLHSATRIHFGPFRYIIGDNVFHRIHHSTVERHFNRNFSAIYPFWDMVFGTAYFPSKDEWTPTGLDDQREPQGMREYLLAPWRRQDDGETSSKSIAGA